MPKAGSPPSGRRTRILRLITRLNVGGPTRHVVWLTAGLNDAEFETLLVAGTVPPGESDMSEFAARAGVHPVVVRSMSREISPADAVTVWRIFRLMRRFRPDVVHTHTAKAGTIGRLAGLLYRASTLRILTGRLRPCRFIHTYHGHIFHSYYGRMKTLLFLTIERLLARFATHRIVVLSAQQFGEIHERFRVGRREQFAVVPLGIDLDAVRRGSEVRACMRRELNVGETHVVVGIVGRLAAIKNHELFLDVAARFQGDAAFVVYGDGSDRERLDQLAHTLGVDDRVTFAGTHDAGEIYAALDVVALTSRNEGTPLSLIEALANGKPVVSTAVGGVVDLLGPVEQEIVSGQTRYEVRERGITVASEDAASFATALERIVADAELRARFAERGRRYAEAVYSKERLIGDVARLTRELAAGH